MKYIEKHDDNISLTVRDGISQGLSKHQTLSEYKMEQNSSLKGVKGVSPGMGCFFVEF